MTTATTTTAELTKNRPAVRLTAALATAAAAVGLIAFGFTGGSTSDQADTPWHCNRDGSVCHDY